MEDSLDHEKTREFWESREMQSSSFAAKAGDVNLFSSHNKAGDKSQLLDKTDLVGTPHHKLLLSNDLAFATPGTTSNLVNDWCRSLEVKTRPVPREQMNSDEAALNDPKHVSSKDGEEEYEVRRPVKAQNPALRAAMPPPKQLMEDSSSLRDMTNSDVRYRDAPVLLAGSSENNQAIPMSNFEAELASMKDSTNVPNQNHNHARASHLDKIYQELENATQIALESAFKDKAGLFELEASCSNLSEAINEYEILKGQAFQDTHSYIRLKNRLIERIICMKDAESEQLMRESSFKSWADMPFAMASSSPRTPSFDVPRVGLRIAHKGSVYLF